MAGWKLNRFSSTLVALGALVACAPETPNQSTAAVDSTVSNETVKAAATPGVVEVKAMDYVFSLPDELPSGWTTFEFANVGQEPHFFLLTLLPDGTTFQNYAEEIGPAFGKAWEALKSGASKADAGAILGENLPAWYGSARAMGGIGLVVPGETARTTLELTPGNYVMECYVKTAEGRFHSELGMMRPLKVTADVTGLAAPEAEVEITLSNQKIAVNGTLTPGVHTVAVHFAEQPPVGLGNDVHLVALSETADLTALTSWIDWMNISGLQTPAPARFLGGAQEMPAGTTAYFTVNVEPGRYAWITETISERATVVAFDVKAEPSEP